jgi:uncharacterized protein GlcG (DUF336 family)
MSNRNATAAAFATLLAAAMLAPNAEAEEALVTYKSISPDIAVEIAQAAMKKCRDDGLQVSVVVMDRFGQQLVVYRDQFAGLPASSTASSKAYTALSFRQSTADFTAAINAKRLSADLGRLPNIVMLGGGLPIESSGSLVGAVGVSGAPGGDKDEACAKAGLEAVQDKLQF